MTEFVIGEGDINKEYFPSFAIIISTLIKEKIKPGFPNWLIAEEACPGTVWLD